MFVLFLVVGALGTDVQSLYPKPTWPQTYTLTDTVWSLPYANLDMPLEFNYNAKCGTRAVWYAGLSTTIQNILEKVDYEIVVEKDKFACGAVNETGPSLTSTKYEYAGGPDDILTTVLPDLTNYEYNRFEPCPQSRSSGVSGMCDVWTYETDLMGKPANYSFWTQNNIPVKFEVYGYNDLFHSHFDHYVMMYGKFDTSELPCSEFEAPSLCEDTAQVSEETTQLRHIFKTGLEQQFHEFLSTHQKVYAHAKEYAARLAVFQNNLQYIRERNDLNLPYTLGMNNFGDRHSHEIDMMKGLRIPSSVSSGDVTIKPLVTWKGDGTDTPITPIHPELQKKIDAYRATGGSSFDWRPLGAVSPVKDQAQCGSCWTFGSTGSLEGTMYLRTQRMTLYSEQYLVDCAWSDDPNYTNMGCNGGFAEAAWTYVKENGGIPTANDYGPYLSVNGMCDPSALRTPATVQIDGFMKVESGNNDALMSSLIFNGPHYVAIDASQKDFTFYQSGVYYNPECMNQEDQLDHAVLAVGYGTDASGDDYWIIKNSWSTYWGDQGFVKMARDGNNCGVSTDAVVPIPL